MVDLARRCREDARPERERRHDCAAKGEGDSDRMTDFERREGVFGAVARVLDGRVRGRVSSDSYLGPGMAAVSGAIVFFEIRAGFREMPSPPCAKSSGLSMLGRTPKSAQPKGSTFV